jgi:hypothetical protein
MTVFVASMALVVFIGMHDYGASLEHVELNVFQNVDFVIEQSDVNIAKVSRVTFSRARRPSMIRWGSDMPMITQGCAALSKITALVNMKSVKSGGQVYKMNLDSDAERSLHKENRAFY